VNASYKTPTPTTQITKEKGKIYLTSFQKIGYHTKAITVDNGTQFDAEAFKEFCEQTGTKIHFASVRHPESNGLVERANGIIMTGIMKLIFNQPRGQWPDELIKVV
jgi:transposase InsO family protein